MRNFRRWARKTRQRNHCTSRTTGLIRGFAKCCNDLVPEPSEGALARLQQRVSYWQGELHLDEWQIVPRFVSRDEKWTARITIHDEFSIGTMEVGDDVEEDEWDWVVVHELVHLILWPTSVLCETMSEHLDRHQAEILEPLLTNAEEIAVNRLTEAIVGARLPVIWEQEE